MESPWKLSFIALLAIMSSACSSTYQQIRLVPEPYGEAEYRQDLDGITLENHGLAELPPELVAQVQACNADGVPVVTSSGSPVMEKVPILPNETSFYKLSITNNTDHVLRLSPMVAKVFDPAGVEHDQLSKADMESLLLSERRCPSTQELTSHLRRVKIIDRNVELLPGSTFTGYMAFFVPRDSQLIPGMWKLALYEIPSETDAAGKVSKTVKFEVRTNVHKFIDTYQRKGLMAPPERIASEEVTG